MRSAVKRRSNAALTRPRSKLPIRLTAATASSSVSTIKPDTPSSMTSTTEPDLKAITGVPQAIASIITSPNGSGQSTGNSNAAALTKKATLFVLGNLADERFHGPPRSGESFPANKLGQHGPPWPQSSEAFQFVRRFRLRDPVVFPARFGRGKRDTHPRPLVGAARDRGANHGERSLPTWPTVGNCVGHPRQLRVEAPGKIYKMARYAGDRAVRVELSGFAA